MHIILMPVPGNIGTSLSEFFSGILGNRAADTDQHIVYSAWRTVQHTAIRTFPFNDALPFSNRRFHDPDFIHNSLLRSYQSAYAFPHGIVQSAKSENDVFIQCKARHLQPREASKKEKCSFLPLWYSVSGRSEAPPVRPLHIPKPLGHRNNFFLIRTTNQSCNIADMQVAKLHQHGFQGFSQRFGMIPAF